MDPRAPHAIRGWWHYSHLVWWQLTGTVLVAGYWWLAVGDVTPGITLGESSRIPRGDVALALAVVFTAAALAQVGYGAAHAERARRYGCW